MLLWASTLSTPDILAMYVSVNGLKGYTGVQVLLVAGVLLYDNQPRLLYEIKLFLPKEATSPIFSVFADPGIESSIV